MLRFIRRSIRTVKTAKIRNTYFLPFILALLIFCYSGLFNTASAASSTTLYVDAKLGFSIQVPTSWVAHPHPPLQATLTNTDVLFTNANTPDTQVEINVIRANNVGKDFGKGQTLFTINKHQAFSADTTSQKQSPIPSARRIMLVGNDYVVATWLSPDAAKHGKQLEQILASYQSQSNAKNQLKTAVINAAATAASCASLFPAAAADPYGLIPNPQVDWGNTLVYPTDPVWTAHFSSGSSVCDNFNYDTSASEWGGYYFQCVELANRFIGEQWGLPATYKNAGQFLDYSNGQNNPVAGGIYGASGGTLPASAFQVSTDGSQMPYQDTLNPQVNFEPSPGDLIIYQDVVDGTSWTSGIYTNSPTGTGAGHVAVIVSVTSNSVEIAQQNYEPTSSLATLSMTKGANGYQITPPDKSYDSSRIVRGWIHLTANPNSATPPPPAGFSNFVGKNADGRLEVFARGTDNNIWHTYQTAVNSTSWSNWSSLQAGKSFNSDPVVGIYNGTLQVFARGTDNKIWIIGQTAPNGTWGQWSIVQNSFGGTFQGTPAVGTMSNGNLVVIARGSDNNMWANIFAGSWQGWTIIPSSPGFNGDPVVGTYAGGMQVFARGNDNKIWIVGLSSSGTWGQWNTVQSSFGGTFQNTPGTGTMPNGNMMVFAMGSDNNIWQNTFASSWQGWSAIHSGWSFNGA